MSQFGLDWSAAVAQKNNLTPGLKKKKTKKRKVTPEKKHDRSRLIRGDEHRRREQMSETQTQRGEDE